METAQESVKSLLDPPRVVELHPDISPADIAHVLLALIAALKLAFAGVQISTYIDNMTAAQGTFPSDTLRRQLTAAEVASTKGCLSLESILLLETILSNSTVRMTHLQFVTYLDIFCDEPELTSVFTSLHLPIGRRGLQLLRAGRGFINLGFSLSN